MAENEWMDQHILLVKKDGRDRLEAIVGFDSYGNVETVEATAPNAERFLRFDPGNRTELEDILLKFNGGFMNNLDYELFQVRFGSFEEEKQGLEEALALPANSEGRELLKQYALDPKNPGAAQPLRAPKAAEIPKVLLTRDEDGQLKAVTGVDEQGGKLKTVDPTGENAGDFLKFDTHGNLLENFFRQFARQAAHPSHTGFYTVAAGAVEKIAAFIDRVGKANPDDKALDPYRVDRQGKIREPQQERFQPFDLNRLDWSEADKLGISRRRPCPKSRYRRRSRV